MQEDELFDAVQRRTGLESRDQAYTITSAVLGVFGQRITEGEAEDIASQLPAHINDVLISKNTEAEEFSADEFVSRVSDRIATQSDVTAPTTELYIRGVMTVLGEAVSGSELDDARNQLPSEFDSLFEPVDMSEQQR
jgi:uncharacterized protein (DUF2267 family)